MNRVLVVAKAMASNRRSCILDRRSVAAQSGRDFVDDWLVAGILFLTAHQLEQLGVLKSDELFKALTFLVIRFQIMVVDIRNHDFVKFAHTAPATPAQF